jgi:uncharacterized protein (DUF58 family)
VLSPSELSRLGSLELIARAVVEGAVAGGHRSPFHGYSAEFSQYRDYRQGDDLKYVDWKLFARTDRVYTKQFRETTNATVLIAIDTSASMNFGGDVTKARYAQMLASAIAFIVSRQGDAVGLLEAGERPKIVVPAAAGVLQRTRVLAAIGQLAFQGRADLAAAVRLANDSLRSKGLLIVLSDLYDHDLDEAAQRELRRSVRVGHDVSVFHVISPGERAPALQGNVELEDLETGESRPVSASMAGEYRRRFERFLERSRERLVREGIDYLFAPTDGAVSAVLRRYLFRRAA